MDDEQERSDRWKRGWEEFTRMNGEGAARAVRAVEAVAPELVRQVVEFAYGEAFTREAAFPLRDRQLVTIGVLTAMGGSEPQLESHVDVALTAGLAPEEIVEAITHAALFCGYPRALNAVAAAKRTFERRGIAPSG